MFRNGLCGIIRAYEGVDSKYPHVVLLALLNDGNSIVRAVEIEPSPNDGFASEFLFYQVHVATSVHLG